MSVAVVQTHARDLDIDDILRRSPEAQERHDAPSILRRSLKMSEEVWIGMHDDKIACVWGLAPPSAISNRAYLWLLTTDLVEQHKFIFVRRSQIVIKDALKRYDCIIGHVKVGNDSARRWLRWLGAEFATPERGYSAFKIRRMS